MKILTAASPWPIMSEGQHWFALLDECAKRHAAQVAELEARNQALEQQLDAQVRELEAHKREAKRKREAADGLYSLLTVATNNLFSDHTLVTKRVKDEIVDYVREQHEQWHALYSTPC
jgi:DNA repair exonuclease SbcCD ATPase subunit